MSKNNKLYLAPIILLAADLVSAVGLGQSLHKRSEIIKLSETSELTEKHKKQMNFHGSMIKHNLFAGAVFTAALSFYIERRRPEPN